MIIAILLTVFVYLILQRVDDTRRERAQKDPASWGSRMGLLFFVGIVCFVGSYLVENMGENQVGGSYEHAMIHSIHEPIHVGLPPF